ncbi:hypothetical protein REPUB_Repub11eG0041100 [Reevesia pubescens]
MSCFSCCEEDEIHKASENGPFVANNSSSSHVGNTGKYRVEAAVTRDTQPVTIQPIAIPAISVDDLKEMTDNFGTKSLIGECSYGRVYYGILKSGKAAPIKKLDSSKQPEQEFLVQVGPKEISWHRILPCITDCATSYIQITQQVSMVSRLKHDNIVELLGYCTYEYASN